MTCSPEWPLSGNSASRGSLRPRSAASATAPEWCATSAHTAGAASCPVTQIPGAVERVEPRHGQRGRVPDVVQPRGGLDQVGVPAQHRPDSPGLRGDTLRVRPPIRQRVGQHPPRDLPSPGRRPVSHAVTLTAVGGRGSLDEPALAVHGLDQTETRQERQSLPWPCPGTPRTRGSAWPPTARDHPARGRQRRWPVAGPPRSAGRRAASSQAAPGARTTRPRPGTVPTRPSSANCPSARRTVFRATPNSPDRAVSDGTGEPGGSSASRARRVSAIRA